MPRKSKKTVSLAVIVLCIAFVFGVKAVIGLSKGKLSGDSFSKIKGNRDAPLKITEFIDFQCPACAYGALYLKEEMQNHPGLIQLQLKYFPLSMHRHGLLSAKYAECALKQRQFWPYHDLLIQRQNNWKQLEDARPAFDQMGSDLNLDVQELQDCVNSDHVMGIIEKNKEEGQKLGIRSTPTYFVNGNMLVGQKSLAQEINNFLEKNGD